MNKREYLDELCRRLRYASADEAQRLVAFVTESIDDRIEEGMTEEEAVAAVGSIDDLVREVSGEAKVETFTDEGGVKGARRRDYVVSADGVEAIEVTEGGGDVSFRVSRDEKIHVHVTESERQRYIVTKKNGLVSVTKEQLGGKDINFGFGLFVFHADLGNNTDVIVDVPDTLRAAIGCKTGSGDIGYALASALAVTLTTGSGDIDVGSCAVGGRAELKTGSGDINIDELMAESVEITAASGDADVKSVTAKALKLSAISGDIEIGEAFIADKAVVKSVSGDVELCMASPLRVGSFESVSGDLNIELYGHGEEYSISAKSVSGDVDAPADKPDAPNAIRARTTSGDIRVEIAG
ncbi:MAG: DUF4097 family beta strand repeat protein [Oscillospiraceae bacterium]|nr:DUF4097 family beta strand repeat protein [Oscillospiraceae bacterium]